MSLDDYRWLVSDAAKFWLAITNQELFAGGAALPTVTSRLRKDLTADKAHLIIEQIDLRHRARDKFALADSMFFTRKGLEQATDEQVAAYKAARFPQGEPIADLCCGIGGDLIALARRGPAHGVDRDSSTAILAAANVFVQGFRQADCSVISADATQFPLAGSPWHCDPDRRKEGRRATRGELFEPPLEALSELLSHNSSAALKLAPATEAPPEWKQSVELEWLSSRGECRQQVAWFGRLARHPGQHVATMIRSDGQTRTVVGQPSESHPQATSIRRYFYEPDSAVLAAKLSAVLCREHVLAAISPGIAYFTSDILVNDAALDAFEVLEVLPLDRKQLKAYCRQHDIGRLEIKKRGVDIVPERLRKEIVAQGDAAATMIIAPMQGQTRAIIAQRVLS